MSTQALLTFLGITAIVVLTPAAINHFWQADLLAQKVTGQIPRIPWSSVIRGIFQPRKESEAASVVFGSAAILRTDGDHFCEVLWNTPLGQFWGSPNDAEILNWLVKEQLAAGVYHTGAASVQAGDVVLDGGSHLGTFTRAALLDGASKVVAFEPAARNIHCFKKTFAGEIEDGRVVLIEAAIWDTPGSVPFLIGEDEHRGSAQGRVLDGAVGHVRAVTIDETIQELQLQRVDFIKMDIEGSERQALRGAAKTLQQFAPRLAICIYHLADDLVVVPKVITGIRPAYSVALTRQFAYFF